jgi:hypothetical protein
LVYQLYGLTEEEIKIVEGERLQGKITQIKITDNKFLW